MFIQPDAAFVGLGFKHVIQSKYFCILMNSNGCIIQVSKNIKLECRVIILRREFKIILDELEWMDDITKKKAHVKVDKMTPYIGYAKEILDNNLINEFYQGFFNNSMHDQCSSTLLNFRKNV